MHALPLPRDRAMDIAPDYAGLRQGQPVSKVRTIAGDTAWLVTRYEDIRALLAEDRLGRSHPDPQNAQRITKSLLLGGPMGNFETELADHTLARRLMAGSFSARRMDALRPRVQQLVDGLLDAVEANGSPADLHPALNHPLPVLVICELLGVPADRRDELMALTHGITNVHNSEQALAAFGKVSAFMAALLEEKRGNPGHDLLTDLVVNDFGERTSVELLLMVAVGVLMAGHETTVARLDFGEVLLLTHRAEWEALAANPDRAQRVVEEILRYAVPGEESNMPRYARADLEIGGVTIGAGDAVLLCLHSANRDAAVFDEPDSFVPDRAENPHLTFGHGRRYCIGASLARMEMQIALTTLARRFPTMKLAVDADQLRLRDDIVAGGLLSVPVTW